MCTEMGSLITKRKRLKPFQVFCDTEIEGPGCIVIARRTDKDGWSTKTDSDEEMKALFTGDAGDSLYSSRDQIFTTYDRNNDGNPRSNCAVDRMGAWWHKDCTDSMYVNGWVTSLAGKGIYWKTCGWLRY